MKQFYLFAHAVIDVLNLHFLLHEGLEDNEEMLESRERILFLSKGVLKTVLKHRGREAELTNSLIVFFSDYLKVWGNCGIP